MRYIIIAILTCLPLGVLAQPMRSERLDFPPTAIGTVDEREVRIDNLPQNASYMILDSCNAPFRVTTPVNELVVKNGELRLKCEFLPTAPGTFRDEIILDRIPITPPSNERIRIRLNGTGFRIERIDRIEFGDVMIGDSTRKMVLIRDNFVRDVRWSITKGPKAPFSTPDAAAPYQPDRDTIGFRFAFAPTLVGRIIDTVGLIRTFIPTGEALDTIRVILDGTGVRMKDSAQVVFNDLTSGMTVTSDLVLQLPTAPRIREFRYTLRPMITSGVVTGTITDPLSASRTRSITTSFTARPRSSRSVREQFVLTRLKLDGTKLDSTTITAIVNMRPQPIQLQASFTADTLVYRIGDTVRFQIIATTETPLDGPIIFNELSTECAINGTVIVPLVNDQISVITRDDRTFVRVTSREPVTISASGDAVLEWLGVVVLGDAAFSPLTLEPVVATLADGKRITLESQSSVLRVSNVWTMPDGTARLINPRASQLEVTIAPNPILASGTITVDNVPAGKGRLEIVDARGIVVADLTQNVRAGRAVFTVATSGSVDVSLQPGIYYARLSAQFSTSETLSSVVRAFVVR
jgi:hypothetical protein